MLYPSKNNIFNENSAKKYKFPVRKQRRQTYKKRQTRRLWFFAILCFVSMQFLPKIYFKTFDYYVLNRINNADIKIPDDTSLLSSTEALFEDNSGAKIPSDYSLLSSAETPFTNTEFLGSRFIANVNTENPLMKRPKLNREMTRLTGRLKALAAPYTSLDAGIFVWDYATGNYVSINGDKEFPTASMVKVPIFLELFKRVEMGLTNLNQTMTLTDYYVSEGSGMLQYKPVGTVLPMYTLAQKMIQESDNSATNMILSTLGGVDGVNADLRNWGFSQTHMSNWLPDLDGTNVSTPYDFGSILYNIDNTNFLSLKSRATIVDIMSHVKNRFLVQAGLPDGVQYIHKTGDIGHMLGDGGIVTLPDGRKYIIVIMVKRPWNSFCAKQFIIDASKTIYNSYASKDF